MDRNKGGRLLPLLAIHAASEYYRLPWRPPVTAGLLAANTLIYFRPAFLHPLLPSIYDVSFNSYLILKHWDLKRFFLSAFYHVGEPHLVYNMLSLLWKGIRLETLMGSADFASMVVALLTLSQGITLLLAKSLVLFFDYDKPFYSEHAVGFSGVLFAMKVVLNSQSDEYTNVYGLMVPARHAAWAELVFVQMLVPGVSFLGHLGGILAGILYLKFKGSCSGSDPLAFVIKHLSGVLSWPLRFAKGLFLPRQQRFSGRGNVRGNLATRTVSRVWRCQMCTYDNSGLSSVCEMCGTSRDCGGLQSQQLLHQSNDLSVEEIRRRRIERFGS